MKRNKLRQRAEVATEHRISGAVDAPSPDLRRLVQELQVHQIELELQNDELKAARSEAERARELYHELFRTAPAGYLMLDRDGVVIECNAAATTLLQRTQSLVGQRIDRLVTQSDRHRLAVHLQWARESKRADCELRLELPGAKLLMVRVDTSPIPSTQGNCLMVLTDMSERQRSQELLERLNLELEQRVLARTAQLEAQNRQLQSEMEARTLAETQHKELESRLREGERLQGLGMLAAGIAHDFNNLLVSVVGNADLLLKRADLPESLRGPLTLMRRTGQDASELTRQLLVFAGQGRMSTSPVSLSELVAECVELVRPRMAQDVHLSMQLASELEPIAADRAQLQRVIINLLTNALEALEGGGEIELGTRIAQLDAADLEKFQHAWAAQPGTFVVLHVADTGRGIDPDSLARIYEPFFSTKFTGRGLGLATVLGIVQSHAGAISVRSTIGRGSRFEVAFPLADAQQVVEPEPRRRDSWRATGSVLVIDDDQGVSRVVEMLLRSMGFQVSTAIGGQAGLEQFERQHFDLVVLDWLMPIMSGESVLRELRLRDPKLPVVLMSGYNADSLGSSDEYVARVQKPMTLEQLEAAIRKVSSGGARRAG